VISISAIAELIDFFLISRSCRSGTDVTLTVDNRLTVSGNSDAGSTDLNTDGFLWLGLSLDFVLCIYRSRTNCRGPLSRRREIIQDCNSITVKIINAIFRILDHTVLVKKITLFRDKHGCQGCGGGKYRCCRVTGSQN